MEIKGKVKEVTERFIRLETMRKKQIIDVFFTENKKKSMNRLFEPQMFAKLEVEPECINVEGNNLVRLWFLYVVSPEYSEPDRMYSDEMQFLFDERKKLYRSIPE